MYKYSKIPGSEHARHKEDGLRIRIRRAGSGSDIRIGEGEAIMIRRGGECVATVETRVGDVAKGNGARGIRVCRHDCSCVFFFGDIRYQLMMMFKVDRRNNRDFQVCVNAVALLVA